MTIDTQKTADAVAKILALHPISEAAKSYESTIRELLAVIGEAVADAQRYLDYYRLADDELLSQADHERIDRATRFIALAAPLVKGDV